MTAPLEQILDIIYSNKFIIFAYPLVTFAYLILLIKYKLELKKWSKINPNGLSVSMIKLNIESLNNYYLCVFGILLIIESLIITTKLHTPLMM